MIEHDTALGYRTRFLEFPSIIPVVLWDDDYAQPEMTQTWLYASNLLGKVAVGETENEPSEWMMVAKLEASPISQLLARLEALYGIPENERWPGALWPADQAFEEARTFIGLLPLTSVPAPEIRLADDGEINFLWKEEGVHIDLGFYGTGAYSYFARSSGGKEFHDEDVPATDGLAGAITALFAA